MARPYYASYRSGPSKKTSPGNLPLIIVNGSVTVESLNVRQRSIWYSGTNNAASVWPFVKKFFSFLAGADFHRSESAELRISTMMGSHRLSGHGNGPGKYSPIRERRALPIRLGLSFLLPVRRRAGKVTNNCKGLVEREFCCERAWFAQDRGRNPRRHPR
jgi:hypothetical protein